MSQSEDDLPADASGESNAAGEEAEQDQRILMALAYGAKSEADLTVGADFAVRVALCAHMTAGNQAEYAKAIKRALVNELGLFDLFPGQDVEGVIKQFWRVVRRARRDPPKIAWLRKQFDVIQTDRAVRQFLDAVERSLTSAFKSKR